MKAQTNNDYYNILLQGCKEAFEVIELKEFLYTGEAMNDNKEIKLSDECTGHLGIEKSNTVIVDYRLQEAIPIAFFKFLERQQVIFKKKYLIDRNEFYKRCLNSININLTELNKKGNRPLRNINDLGTPPDVLEFLEYIKWDIKHKSLQSNETPKAPQQIDTKNTDEVDKHPKHDPNLWNVQCFDLFKYIFNEYYKGTKRQLTNIWFYLKEYQSNKYVFSATKDEYIIFIEENYSITIKNFDKAENKYAEKEYGKMNEHRINFERNLK